MTPLPREVHLETVVVEHPEVDCYAWLRATVTEAIAGIGSGQDSTTPT